MAKLLRNAAGSRDFARDDATLRHVSPKSLRRQNPSLTNGIPPQTAGFWNPWLQLALSVVCVLASELLLKRGASATADPASAWSWTGIGGLVSPLVWLAIVFVIMSFLSWLYVLKFIPLSTAFPLSRVVDALVPLGSWIFLGESISARRWCGIALVIIGLAIVVRPVARMEERL